MTKVQNPKNRRPTRSDSLSRMLELEKKFKMQRVQDNESKLHIPPSTSDPFAQTDSPLKSQRPNGGVQPPLSHQNQMMETVRRGSGLPSLSLSIPPSPTSPSAVGGGGTDEKVVDTPLPRKESRERTKTVKFSDPEEDESGLSDESSICHSPSWEGYDLSKSKIRKREAELKRKEKERQDKENKAPERKQQSRLSKAPPQDTPEAKLLKATDRSMSAPEILRDRSTKRSNSEYPPDSMANHQYLQKPAQGEQTGKPKRQGFLSGFRLQHGNVAAVQKLMSNTRVSMDDTQSKSGSSYGPSSHPAGPETNLDFNDSRKAPSINSSMSASTQSMSSQDRRPIFGRKPSSSRHGRSHSFLSRLKGPSYLYHNGKDSGKEEVYSRPGSSQQSDVGTEQPATFQESTRTTTGFSSSQMIQEPEAEVSRGRQPRTQFPQSRNSSSDPSSGYETSNEAVPRDRMPQQSSSHVPTANEEHRRHHNYYVEHVRQQQFEDTSSPSMSRQVVTNITPEVPPRERQRRRPPPVHVSKPTQHRAAISDEPSPRQSSVRPIQNNDQASFYIGEIGQVNIPHSTQKNDDQASVGTHASTIRPISRGKESNTPESGRKLHDDTLAAAANLVGQAITHDRVGSKAPEKESFMRSSMLESRKNVRPGTAALGVLRPEKSADYFTFVSESYAPPSLELKSPMESKFPSSPRIEEESYEDVEASWTELLITQENQHVPQETANGSVIPSKINEIDATSKFTDDSKFQCSPAVLAHQSDDDVPAIERLDVPQKAAKVPGVGSTNSTITEQQSRSTSDRSSSSTYDEVPPPFSRATTPDNSRAQSRRSPRVDAGKPSSNGARTNVDERGPRKLRHTTAVEKPPSSNSRSASRDATSPDDNWNRTALPLEFDHHSPTVVTHFARPEGLASSPSLVGTPTSVTFTDVVKEGFEEGESPGPRRQTLPQKAHSSIDLPATGFLPPLKHQPLYSKKNKSLLSSVSLPNSPPPELETDIVALRPSALKMSRNDSESSQDSSVLISAGAAYLQEARKSAPVPPASSSRALRPIYSPKNSLPHIKGTMPPEKRGEPMAKMLVECCNCKYFHDMPSKVYECMAKPDSVVEDKFLGVSAAITTMVKCPWCSHGMSTQCCAGYAAVVYLKEKLHGK